MLTFIVNPSRGRPERCSMRWQQVARRMWQPVVAGTGAGSRGWGGVTGRQGRPSGCARFWSISIYCCKWQWTLAQSPQWECEWQREWDCVCDCDCNCDWKWSLHCPQIGPGAVRRSRQCNPRNPRLPLAVPSVSVWRVAAAASASIDSLIGCVVFPIPPPVILLASSGASGVTSTRRIRDSDDV